MSSPTSRRSNRSSVNGTPRRSQRNSNVPMSDASLPDANGADEQLQSEASQQEQETTPRANARSSQNESQSQAPPTSSPLFFRSSPAGSQSQSQSQGLNVPAGTRGVGASSPLRQQSDAASSQGGRTPRASGAIGGTYFCPRDNKCRTNKRRQTPRLFITERALMLLARQWTIAGRSAVQLACLCAPQERDKQLARVNDDTTSIRMSSSRAVDVFS